MTEGATRPLCHQSLVFSVFLPIHLCLQAGTSWSSGWLPENLPPLSELLLKDFSMGLGNPFHEPCKPPSHMSSKQSWTIQQLGGGWVAPPGAASGASLCHVIRSAWSQRSLSNVCWTEPMEISSRGTDRLCKVVTPYHKSNPRREKWLITSQKCHLKFLHWEGNKAQLQDSVMSYPLEKKWLEPKSLLQGLFSGLKSLIWEATPFSLVGQ